MTSKVKHESPTDLPIKSSSRLLLHPVDPERWLYEVSREGEETDSSRSRVRIFAPPKSVALRDL